MSFNQEEFNHFVIKNQVIGFFDSPVCLKSGIESTWYVNWRTLSNQVSLLESVSNYVLAFTKEKGLVPDCFYGVPEGATKLGLMTQFLWAKQQPDKPSLFPMGRSKPKEHGSPVDKYFVGAPAGKVIVLEDVTTTGGSLYACIGQLKKLNVDVIAAIGLTDRREGNQVSFKKIKDLGVPYYALSQAKTLLEMADV